MVFENFHQFCFLFYAIEIIIKGRVHHPASMDVGRKIGHDE